MSDSELVFQYFVEFLYEHRSWLFSPLADECDRCGEPFARPVRMQEPLPLQFVLCDICTEHVLEEAAKEYSGYLGLAGVYALAYATAERRRPVKGAGAERSEGHP